MCSIIGSFSKEKIVELCELNAYRGQHSHSFSYYDIERNDFTEIRRAPGPINYDGINIPDNHYCIVHMQAPTTEVKDNLSIHPAIIERDVLWHNGILKAKEIERLKAKYQLITNWDTYIYY